MREKLTGHGTVDSPERVTALAVAVASADRPSATLEKLAGQVLGGAKVEVVLKDLLSDGKGSTDSAKSKKASR